MKVLEPGVALAALYTRDPKTLEKTFDHMTRASLDELDQWMKDDFQVSQNEDYYRTVAKAVIRRMTHRCLQKYERIPSANVVEESLKHYTLPNNLQQEISEKYGHPPPRTWFDALAHLKEISENDSLKLWQLVLEHPMTSYVPMQCQECGHIVPDDNARSPLTDADVGLVEKHPTGAELEIRGGWYRGRPRDPVLLELLCPKCGAVSEWYRSGHPKVILNPNRWGRLCGEQEELRLALANYLGIAVRTVLPLDWDHIWSEFSTKANNSVPWHVRNTDESNFCCRLDEGIGTWTGVVAISTDPRHCEDITDAYLSYDRAEAAIGTSKMSGYRRVVTESRKDYSGDTTQAKTLNGFVIERAGMFGNELISEELKKAASDFGARGWWEID